MQVHKPVENILVHACSNFDFVFTINLNLNLFDQ